MKITYTEMNLTPSGDALIWDMYHLTPVKGELYHPFDLKRFEQEQIKFCNAPTCATFKRKDGIHYVQFNGDGWTKELCSIVFEYWYNRQTTKISLSE